MASDLLAAKMASDLLAAKMASDLLAAKMASDLLAVKMASDLLAVKMASDLADRMFFRSKTVDSLPAMGIATKILFDKPKRGTNM